MNKAEKKFRIYAIIAVFMLITLLLSIINIVNFTMAAEDADNITQQIADRQGNFERNENAPGNMPLQPKENDFKMGPMGPDSPEMNDSLRYFTVAFSKNGTAAEIVSYHISAVTETDAKEWASELVKEKTGWTRGTYRYRVYKKSGVTYVTVIDEGRELLPSFRILVISVVGEVLVLVIGWFVLLFIGRKIYAPIEEADRKQKNFIKSANKEFRVPLTVLYGNTELAEKKYGPDDETRSTRRQLAKLNELIDKLGNIGIFENEDIKPAEVQISEYLTAALDNAAEEFSSRGLNLKTDIEPDITISADPESIKKLTDELIKNALKFALSEVSFTLKKDSGYVLLVTLNDTNLPDGPIEQVFDRFTMLDNAKGTSGAGLGLSYVKEIVRAHNGRASATVLSGVFTLSIAL